MRPRADRARICLPEICRSARHSRGGQAAGGGHTPGRDARAGIFCGNICSGMHGTTFGGGPLACAVALEFLNVIEDQNLLANIRARGVELREGLGVLAKKFDFIQELRGEGLLLGFQLTVEGAPFVAEALKRGVLINCTHETTLRFLPPFIIKPAHVKDFLSRMEMVFAKTKKPNPKAAESSRTNSLAESARALAVAR